MDGEALESIVGMYLLEETSPSFRWVLGFWCGVISSAHNLAVVQTVKKTSHNIEQHLYGFDIE
jgi:hypothetical protein